MARRSMRHNNGYYDEDEQNEGNGIESFYTVQGDRTYVSTGNLGQKLGPAGYTMKYCRNTGEPYLKPNEIARIDDTTHTKQMKEIMGICTNFIDGVNSNSIADLGYKTKFGILLEGPPGTGKSQTINVAAQTFIDNGGIVVGIADEEVLEYGAGDYLKRVNSIQPDLPILVILEDLDGYNDYIERTLTSFLDGENSPQNVLFMGTTNFCSNISERLKRPGRFDIIYTVEGMTTAVRRKYIKDKLKTFGRKVTKVQMEEFMSVTKEYNFAQLRTFMAYIGVFGFDAKTMAERMAKSRF